MSGHSKWHSIRQKKGAADAKRGKIFSKISKAITVIAREGGSDPSTNFSLRLAIEKAKQANMPKDNIQRAIDRSMGSGNETKLETVFYDGMGPGGVAFIVEAVTDNKNRTYSNIKMIFNKLGGNMEAKVMWMFERKGVVRIEDISKIDSKDVFELEMIDYGAEEIIWNDGLEIISGISDLQKIESAISNLGLIASSAELEYVPKDTINILKDDEVKLERFIETLDDDDDVTNVYTNAG